MRTFKLVTRESPGNYTKWVVEGLKDQLYNWNVVDRKDKTGNQMPVAPTPQGEPEYYDVPDTELMVGLNHSCDTTNNIVASILSCLYNHHQVAHNVDGEGYELRDGDIIKSEAMTYHPARWDVKEDGTERRVFEMPAMTFKVIGCHVVLESLVDKNGNDVPIDLKYENGR